MINSYQCVLVKEQLIYYADIRKLIFVESDQYAPTNNRKFQI